MIFFLYFASIVEWKSLALAGTAGRFSLIFLSDLYTLITAP
jgi:hypothetical protein